MTDKSNSIRAFPQFSEAEERTYQKVFVQSFYLLAILSVVIFFKFPAILIISVPALQAVLTFSGARALSKTKPREEIDLLQLPTNLAELITPFVLAWVCLAIIAILIPQGTAPGLIGLAISLPYILTVILSGLITVRLGRRLKKDGASKGQ
jgi:hypothetical protein